MHVADVFKRVTVKPITQRGNAKLMVMRIKPRQHEKFLCDHSDFLVQMNDIGQFLHHKYIC